MAVDPSQIAEEDKKYIIEKVVEGFETDEIHYLFKQDCDNVLTESTINNFIESEEGASLIDLERRVQEKKSEVGREELIKDLKEQKEILKERSRQLRENDLDEINNETINTVFKSIRMLGEFIDELSTEDEAKAGTVNINRLEQHFDLTQTIKYLPPEDKKSIIQQLKDDESIEDYVIVRKEDAEEESGEDEEEREEVEAEA